LKRFFAVQQSHAMQHDADKMLHIGVIGTTACLNFVGQSSQQSGNDPFSAIVQQAGRFGDPTCLAISGLIQRIQHLMSACR
jgi:hypothetical protein